MVGWNEVWHGVFELDICVSKGGNVSALRSYSVGMRRIHI
jgi:hypothetical protein